MKKILGSIAFTVVAACLTGSMAMAATTCPTGQYSAYTGAGFSCATNNLTFSNFGFSGSSIGAPTPTPASIGVLPIVQVGNEGFQFNPGFILGPNQSQDATVSFLVTAGVGTSIEDLFIGFNGIATGTGATSFTETYCTTGFLTGTCGNFQVINGVVNQHLDITATDHLYITKDFGAQVGATGSASISTVINQYSNTSAVPEPASLSMMGLGLLGLGLIGQRRKV
jgi:hypothetical protein